MDTAVWMPGDFNGDGKTDLANAWNNGGLVSIAVYLSDGTRFLDGSAWADRAGGWGDGTIKWMVGDFDGDGKDDISTAWNNDGLTTLTVRLSQDNKFTPFQWNLDAGRWYNSAVFVAGDFNNDGRDDIAQLWNDIGRTSIKVSLSNGSGFTGPVSWAERDGGWGAIARWTSGDFNGDGRTDIADAWNSDNTNTLTVRASDGNQFIPAAQWAMNAGGWSETAAWCAGKFQ